MIKLQAFSLTFFGEWGDKSQVSIAQQKHVVCVCESLLLRQQYSTESEVSFQLATIGLAADENPFGVVLGGIM